MKQKKSQQSTVNKRGGKKAGPPALVDRGTFGWCCSKREIIAHETFFKNWQSFVIIFKINEDKIVVKDLWYIKRYCVCNIYKDYQSQFIEIVKPIWVIMKWVGLVFQYSSLRNAQHLGRSNIWIESRRIVMEIFPNRNDLIISTNQINRAFALHVRNGKLMPDKWSTLLNVENRYPSRGFLSNYETLSNHKPKHKLNHENQSNQLNSK